jgi:hypothetical protein
MIGMLVHKPQAFVAILLAAMLAICVVPALASTTVYPTHIFNEAGVIEFGHKYRLSVAGSVDSKKARCIPNRTLKLYFKRGHSRRLRDVGHSSRNGEWAVTAESRAAPKRFIVKVAHKRIVRGQHRHFACAADHFVDSGHHHGGPPPG